VDFTFEFGAQAAGVRVQADALKLLLPNGALGAQYQEHWHFPQGRIHQNERFHWIENESHLCGAICLSIEAQDLESLARDLYRDIFALTQGWHLHRLWQFIPDINADTNGLENYQAYNKGRSEAFAIQYPDAPDALLPAASAVGTTGKHVILAFIAGRHSATHLENPKQTPAYRYPEKYGPRPPSFARATAVDTDPKDTLYVSGTASIRGSENVGDSLEAQIATTFENIGIMQTEFSKHHPEAKPSSLKRYRVYIRHPKDFPRIKSVIDKEYRQPGDVFSYLVADICRAELDIEIELTQSS